jgi:hypothetical protein
VITGFILGLVIGCILGGAAVVFVVWRSDRSTAPRHLGPSKYPRKTTMPKVNTRIPGKPTNIGEPNAEVRQAQFRARRETKD